MARLTVIDVEEQSRVPYLRGILTRSLQNAGLDFDEAYQLADELRDELGETEEITNVELRRWVQKRLDADHPEVAQRYGRRGISDAAILLASPDGEDRPYSRGRHRLELMSTGLTPDMASRIVAEVYRQLLQGDERRVDGDLVRRLTHDTIERELGGEAARRYRVWERFTGSDRSLLVLIGGTVGTGKSTVATALANRLGIVRIQSTDMLREVMRALVPEDLLPVLYRSSYTAWEALPGPEHHQRPTSLLLAEGYLSQAEPVALAYRAVVERALRERLSLILEGVHVHPGWLTRLPEDTDAIIVPIMLAVLSRKQLRKRIAGRGRSEPDRRAERYLANFDSIWQLQSFLLSEADEMGVPIVFNEELEATVQQATGVVLGALSEHFAAEGDEPTRAKREGTKREGTKREGTKREGANRGGPA